MNIHPPPVRQSLLLALFTLLLMALVATAAEDPANPESTPLEDRSKKAGPRAEPVEDESRRAGKDSRPVEDESRRAGKDSQPAGKDATPVEDQGGKANEKSRKVEDNAKKAGTDVEKVEDDNPRKASPEARRTRDGSQKAGPDAARVEDSNDDKASPDARETSTAERRRKAAKPRAELGDDPDLTAAEESVVRAHENLARAIQERKLRIQGRDEASGMIQEILGKEGSVSRAEVARGELAEARRANREDRRAAADFLRARLRGQAEARELPPFFHRPDTGAGRAVISDPIYLHEGRRYIHFPSRDAIPAVLLASAALDRVRIHPASEINPRFFGEKVLLPDEYRGEGAWVVSYPIATNSMISSHDILFREGSTQFADGHSYDTVLALTDAMQDPALASERFVIEGHASAEGSHADNQVLSQLRAEAIVREMVRGGVSPERLIPVGYGESEAHHPADAAESLLRQDRRVVVFRIDEPATR